MYRSFGVVVALVFFCVPYGHTEDDLPPVTPHKPVLSKNADAELCSVFTSARHNSAHWQAAFPEAEVFSFVSDHGKTSHLVIDFDSDGEEEVIHIESADHGWRYLGAGLYLFETEEDYHKARAISEKHRPGRDFRIDGLIDPYDPATSALLAPAPTRLYYYPCADTSLLLPRCLFPFGPLAEWGSLHNC